MAVYGVWTSDQYETSFLSGVNGFEQYNIRERMGQLKVSFCKNVTELKMFCYL